MSKTDSNTFEPRNNAETVTFNKELYRLMFYNPKKEFAFYLISFVIALVYAVFNFTVLKRPQESSIREGAVVGVVALLGLVLGYAFVEVKKKAKVVEGNTSRSRSSSNAVNQDNSEVKKAKGFIDSFSGELNYLLEDVAKWNQWRKENPELQPRLNEINLSQANLWGVNLSKINLKKANFRGANLYSADLSDADLSGADLSFADIRKANFSRAKLNEANLSQADLRGANLQNASLKLARLIDVKLDGANLSEAYLWETQRAGWTIKGVNCDLAYWNRESKEKNHYNPGEFERLFAEQTKIRLFYKDGISAIEIATLPALIQHLEEMQGCSLRLVSITDGAGGAVVELAIEDNEYQSTDVVQLRQALQEKAQQNVEYRRNALDEQKRTLLLEGQVRQLNFVVDELILRQNKDDKSEAIQLSDKPGIIMQLGVRDDSTQAHDNTFNQQINEINQSIDLVALATELAQLRIAIANMQDSSPKVLIAAGEIARAEIAADEKDESKVVKHLKAAGKYALDMATKIDTRVAAEMIKKAMGM